MFNSVVAKAGVSSWWQTKSIWSKGMIGIGSIAFVYGIFNKKRSDQIPEKNTLHLSDEDFWNKVGNVPTIVNEDDPVVLGNTTFSNLAEVRQDMAMACSKTSDYVKKYLIQSDFKGAVLDLGCGIGANAIPLIAKGCQLTVIDREAKVIKEYKRNEKRLFSAYHVRPLHRAKSVVGDITTEPYPANIDAVICVDTLPYLLPSQLRTTMHKIFQALQPGGKFVGTIFFKTSRENSPHIDAMGKLGAHFYMDKDFAREIITRSGFQIKKEREHQYDGFSCLEFLAEKPAHL